MATASASTDTPKRTWRRKLLWAAAAALLLLVARKLHEATRKPKELHVLRGANHATMFREGGEALVRKIAVFLRNARMEPEPEAEGARR